MMTQPRRRRRKGEHTADVQGQDPDDETMHLVVVVVQVCKQARGRILSHNTPQTAHAEDNPSCVQRLTLGCSVNERSLDQSERAEAA